MTSSSHDFVTVDMRGLKAALVGRARAGRLSVSMVVRRAVERELGLVNASADAEISAPLMGAAASTVKLSIRLTVSEADQLAAAAKRAALSRGAFIAALLAGMQPMSGDSGSRPECIAALTASCAELSTLTRSINHLTALLRQGNVQAAREYRHLLDTLGADVRAHLRLAGGVLAGLRPFRATKHRSEPQGRHAPMP